MEGLNSDLQVVKQQLHEAQRTTTEERAQVCNAGPSVVSTMRCVLLTWVSRSQNGRLQVALTTAKSARESLEAEIAHMKQQTSHNSSVRGASMCVYVWWVAVVPHLCMPGVRKPDTTPHT